MKVLPHISQPKNGNYTCNEYNEVFSSRGGHFLHIKCKHVCVRFSCDKFDYKDIEKINLTTHIQSKHEGVRYSCDKCDYKAT